MDVTASVRARQRRGPTNDGQRTNRAKVAGGNDERRRTETEVRVEREREKEMDSGGGKGDN